LSREADEWFDFASIREADRMKIRRLDAFELFTLDAERSKAQVSLPTTLCQNDRRLADGDNRSILAATRP
jgi:hypothetical protein